MSLQKKTLDTSSPVPLYYQLQEHIRTLIEERQLDEGTLLPTESEISDLFNVSRATVREALRGLAERGLIEKRQGVGSFVASTKIDEILPGLASFSTEMRARGFDVRSEVLERTRLAPPMRVLNALQLPGNSEVVKVRRLRFVNNNPFVISTSYLLPEISLDEDFSGSLYEILESRYGHRITAGRTSIEAGLADDYEADLLDMNIGSAVLRITWLALADRSTPVEYSETTYRGDRYRYVVYLHR
ncbi:GntR family transcriptional regulator [Oscillatoria laete-virens NRMC-F 0139]|jgi:GntR family transcriptional regulator|nr:GntR family transcriptional regulator [Oscillatoria laete-virens]MDL5054618.1 GntR family transcriptional regulator [Oscillatoria laete-virens NRMC-F 0139]